MESNNLVSAFFERKDFKKNEPWSFIELDSPAKRGRRWTTQPHYADTIEFLFTNRISGEAYIDGVRLELDEKTALFIPPRAVHSMNYNSGNGEVFCGKIDSVGLKPFIELEKVLEFDGKNFKGFCFRNTAYEELIADFRFLTGSEVFSKKLARLIGIFTHLDIRTSIENRSNNDARSSELREIIEWTEMNIGAKPTLSAAAEHFGYNRNYFCEKFKSSVGVSYTEYVNALRINKACEMIGQGISTAEVLRLCGFATESYFVQLFVKVKGCTPGVYRKSTHE